MRLQRRKCKSFSVKFFIQKVCNGAQTILITGVNLYEQVFHYVPLSKKLRHGEEMQYNILSYGAVGDGVTKCTQAIQAAIDACAGSGGQVLIPAGRFLSGTLCLGSDMELHLESGAVLISSLEEADMQDLTGAYQDDNKDSGWEGGCFLHACHIRNLTISGAGIIDGQGCKIYYEDDADNGLKECPMNIRGFRPRMTFLEDVENLTIQDVTFRDAAFWTLHMAGCRNVRIDGIKILNNDRGPNNDGIDPDCCKNVIICGCIISGGDDAIVIKATGPMFQKYGNCEDIVIEGCILHSRSSALKIGTETHGNIRNIMVSNCILKDCSRGIGIWSRDGGEISDIHIHHITGNTLRYADCIGRAFSPAWWGKGEPIYISATKRKNTDRIPGKIHAIYMDHISIMAESSIFLAGEEYSEIEDVQMQDINICWRQKGKHSPEVFDEQPSERDVYKHEIPCIYMRNTKNVVIKGKMDIDASLADIMVQKEIKEQVTENRGSSGWLI